MIPTRTRNVCPVFSSPAHRLLAVLFMLALFSACSGSGTGSVETLASALTQPAQPAQPASPPPVQPAPPAPPPSLPVQTGTPALAGLFSDTSGYNYAPSVIDDGHTRQVWWCGYGVIPGGTLQTDVIFYRTIDIATGTMSPIQTAFWPQAGQWDGRFTCDPSVIAGTFQYAGQNYAYALYYTATDRDDGTNNRIGLAFSNDGVTWTRYAQNPIIYPQVSPAAGYGAGQAATWNRDGASAVVLVHTDLSAASVFLRTSPDGINFGAPVLVSSQGVTLVENNDFAYDPNTDTIYAAIEFPVTAGDRETRSFGLYRMPAAQWLSGQGIWERLTTVDTSITGGYLNHSPGLVRDGFGRLNPTQLEAIFSEGTNDPLTWSLHSIKWQ